MRQRFPKVRLIVSEENLGFGRANNLGLARADGDYILLLNPDTAVPEDVFLVMVRYMERNPEAGMISPKLVTGDGSLDLACRRSFPSLWDGFCRAVGLSALFPQSPVFARYNLTYLDENETYEVDSVNGAFMFMRRDAYEEVGGFDDAFFMYVEDLDLCYRFKSAGWRVVYHPGTTVLHFKGKSGNAKSEQMIHELFRSTELFYRKHYFAKVGLAQRWAILAGVRLWKYVTLLRNALRRRKRTRP